MDNGKASKLSGIFKIKAKCCKKDLPRLKKNKKKKEKNRNQITYKEM